MNLPFALEASIGAHEAQYDLEVLLTADPAADIERDSLQACAEMVELMPRAANLQLLSARGDDASVQLADKQVSADGRRWRWRLRADRVPGSSWAVLVALLVQATHAGDPLSRVRLVAHPATPPRDAAWLLACAAEGTVLARKAPWPFATQLVEPDGGERRISLCFAQPMEKYTRELFEEAINVWDHLVTFGGFVLSFEEQEGFDPSMGAFDAPEPDRLEHRLYCDGDPAAFRSLLSMCELLHRQGHALTRVEIS